MAKGFIILENGQDFFTRWTGYDLIIEIVIDQIQKNDWDPHFCEWLKTRIPSEHEEKGDAVFYNSNDEMIQRILDLRGLTKNNRALFWKTVEAGRLELNQKGKAYSPLNPDRINELADLHHKTPDHFSIEYELEDYLIIQGESVEKSGPGWKNNPK